MSRYYRFLYAWGFTAWEADAENVAPELRTLVDRVKDGLERSFGAAPDLGCRRGGGRQDSANVAGTLLASTSCPRRCGTPGDAPMMLVSPAGSLRKA